MRAIRITRANWLNDYVGGDQNAIKIVPDDVARDAVEMHEIAVYAPEHDPVQFVGTEHAAQRTEALKVKVDEWQPVVDQDDLAAGSPVDIEASDFGQPREYIEEDIARNRPEEPLEIPRSVDNKAAWVRWAVYGDHGQPAVTEEQASAMPKLQLQHRYGGRL